MRCVLSTLKSGSKSPASFPASFPAALYELGNNYHIQQSNWKLEVHSAFNWSTFEIYCYERKKARGLRACMLPLENFCILWGCFSVTLDPGPPFKFCSQRAWCAKICHVTSLLTSMGVAMETPPFTMTSFQSAQGQVGTERAIITTTFDLQ